jgi:hypothetical protein
MGTMVLGARGDLEQIQPRYDIHVHPCGHRFHHVMLWVPATLCVCACGGHARPRLAKCNRKNHAMARHAHLRAPTA